ncbi:MAG: squalene--hopene cyclase [Pirellula sp.]
MKPYTRMLCLWLASRWKPQVQSFPGTIASTVALALCFFSADVEAQPGRDGTAFQGQSVPRDVREMYDRGLMWMENSQDERGGWTKTGGMSGGGVSGLALMAFLASGEDPNFGKYSAPVRKAIQAIIMGQNANTGYLGDSMYQHGFATLALAEAYGAVDERNFWPADADKKRTRSIGQALELAIRTSVTSQDKNTYGGWRYSPDASDSDTSVAGAVLMSMLAARNAGIEVPDKNIDRAIKYFTSMTSNSGQVAYAGGMGGFDNSPARVSIATLVYAIAGRKDLKEYKATSNFLKSSDSNEVNDHYGEYTAYYKAQALFQADLATWEKWNKNLIQELKKKQRSDGHFDGNFGPAVATSMNLLALALNFRFLPIYER